MTYIAATRGYNVSIIYSWAGLIGCVCTLGFGGIFKTEAKLLREAQTNQGSFECEHLTSAVRFDDVSLRLLFRKLQA